MVYEVGIGLGVGKALRCEEKVFVLKWHYWHCTKAELALEVSE